MLSERPQDKWFQPDPAARLRTYSERRMKGVWLNVVWSGVLLAALILKLSRQLENVEENDVAAWSAVATPLVLGRFGYYIFRLRQARNDIAAMKRSLGAIAPQ